MPRIILEVDLKIVGGKGAGARGCRSDGWAGLHIPVASRRRSPILSDAIKRILAVEWADFPPHFRLTKLRVERFGPLTVGIDAHGQSIYQQLDTQARERLPQILSVLSERRGAANKPRS